MHEYSIARALHRMVVERARSEAARAGLGDVRVLRVEVVVGELAGVVPELLETAWAHTCSGPCAGAELAIRHRPTAWRCEACGAGVPASGPLRCPACRGAAELASGAELHLERLALDGR